jgi:transcription initiation factor TFIIIB Brf1 subunit/transcription initiation factor TFIIB
MAKINLHSGMNHKDRALHQAYTQFDHICKGKLKLNDVIVDYAKVMYKKFNSEKLTRGAVRAGVKANCVLYACKEHGVTRTLQEFSDAFGIPVKDISRTSDIFGDATGETTGKTHSSDIISRLFNDITFIPDSEKGRVRMKVIKACDDAQTNPNLMGKTPKGVASAVIFKTLIDMGYSVDRIFIAKICDVSVPTLNKIEKILVETLH